MEGVKLTQPKNMDNEGIDPSTSRMRNERSTTDLIAQAHGVLSKHYL
jgi:hypothetical protein